MELQRVDKANNLSFIRASDALNEHAIKRTALLMSVIGFALLLAIIIVVRLISIRLRNSSRDVQRSMGDVTQVLQEAIDGHKVVKLFGGRQYEAERFNSGPRGLVATLELQKAPA